MIQLLKKLFNNNNNEEIMMSKKYKQEIERLNRVVEILEERHEIARKLLLERDNIIQKYKDNFIEYYKYDELQNNYINVVQILNNKENKESA
tara:strand:- start:88 stop:363 length:276 start_codon:yes stop_codon:yes gene_type:complete